MKPNKLRLLLNDGKPTLGTHVQSTWPTVVEMIGHSGMFDYVEFLAEYGPFDLYALDNFCRAAELFGMSSMIKVDQEPRSYIAQRGIGSGFQSVLFADCRSVEEVRECVQIVRPDTPRDGGTYGIAPRRFCSMRYKETQKYAQMLRDIVVVIMIEKQGTVEQLEEVLSVEGVDMIQWGPADYSMNVGQDMGSSKVKAVERKVFETALKMGVPPRAEINSMDQAKYFLDMGVQHFCMGTDLVILLNWWKRNGEALRKAIEDA